MPTSYHFTTEQIAEIERLRDELAKPEHASTPSGGVPLYSYIFRCITGLDPGEIALDLLKDQVQNPEIRNSAVWLAGAIMVNSNQGAFSNMIRGFNVRQGELRGEGIFSEELLQEASNKVSLYLANSILNQLDDRGLPNPTYHRLPTVQEIGMSDLNGVRDVLYPGNEDPGDELYLNQAWPGIVMLGALGGEYWDRLLRYDDVNQPAALDSLGDIKAMLFCWEAFSTAWDRYCIGATEISDALIWLNFPTSLIGAVLAEFSANGPGGVARTVFRSLVNMQNPAPEFASAMTTSLSGGERPPVGGSSVSPPIE